MPRVARHKADKPVARKTGKAPARAPINKGPKKQKAKTARKLDPAEEARRRERIMAGLDALYPNAECELDYKNPFQLLAAVILSAQCTDKRVNMVTPNLFARFPDAAAMAEADPVELQEIIKSTGFYRNKTKSLIGMSRAIMEDFDGRVPASMDELLTLPGVARKTANVILGTAFHKNEGFVVDTHIGRLSGRLGFTRETDPVKVERDLCAIFPREKWTQLGHQLIWHGRRVCFARKPDCAACALQPDCPSAGKA